MPPLSTSMIMGERVNFPFNWKTLQHILGPTIQFSVLTKFSETILKVLQSNCILSCFFSTLTPEWQDEKKQKKRKILCFIPRILTHRTHFSRTLKKTWGHLITLSRNVLFYGVRWDSVPFNLWSCELLVALRIDECYFFMVVFSWGCWVLKREWATVCL